MANGHGGARVGAGHKTQIVTDTTADYFVEYSAARAKEKEDADFVGRLTRYSFMALLERIASLLMSRTKREIMEGLRHEIRETLQAISDGLNNS